MMTILFCGMILSGILLGGLTGRMPQVSQAAIEQSGEAVRLTLSLLGNFCLWGGMMKVAEQSGLTRAAARAFAPLTRRLFRGIDTGGAAMRSITMNLTANLLGLGNAATPLGITAMKELKKEERARNTATDNMALFVVMNTASLQLIPTTTAMLRSAAGCEHPLDILPSVWIASAVSVVCGIVMAKLLAGRRTKR